MTLSEQPSLIQTKIPPFKTDNCTVAEVVDQKFDPKTHNDNMADLLKKFQLWLYADPPGHYNWKCARCGRVCFSEEVFFPCKQSFVTTRVICRLCNVRWRLQIDIVIPKDAVLQ
jgi:hypothetical protein